MKQKSRPVGSLGELSPHRGPATRYKTPLFSFIWGSGRRALARHKRLGRGWVRQIPGSPSFFVRP